MGKCVEEYFDRPYSLIQQILIGLDECDENAKTGYEFAWLATNIYQSRSSDKSVRSVTATVLKN
jgi:hypothetical protein